MSNARDVIANIRALHRPDTTWTNPEGTIYGPCEADRSAWPCDAEYAARLLEDPAAAADVERLARGLHRDQTFDAECYAAEFDAPNCPCRRNIERILVAAESVTESVTDAPDGSGQSGEK